MRVLHKLDDVGFTRQGMINMELPGSSRRGRSQKKNHECSEGWHAKGWWDRGGLLGWDGGT